MHSTSITTWLGRSRLLNTLEYIFTKLHHYEKNCQVKGCIFNLHIFHLEMKRGSKETTSRLHCTLKLKAISMAPNFRTTP
jgi:hypothetical protein